MLSQPASPGSNTTSTGVATCSVTDLRCEHQREGFALGLGTATPRLSWTTTSAAPGWRQTAYQVEATRDGQVQTTGRVESDASVLVAWPFAPLASRAHATVRVRVWGAAGQATASQGAASESGWSAPLAVEAGLLHPTDWSARFITPDWDEDVSQPQPSPLLRTEFDVRGPVRQARLYVTALGVYQAELNGTRVSEDVMAPGWTSYSHRLRYQTYDVTALLTLGRNALGATLGEGWFRGRLGYHGGRRAIYGDRIALLAQLELEYADGTRAVIASDDTWQAATGPLLASEIYNGESYDARLERPGWSTPGFAASGWAGVRTVDRDLSTLVAPSGPPVRRTEELAPVAITTSPSGKTLVDFGQNLVGYVRLRVAGPAGTTVTLRHAEVLEGGELGTRPLRYAQATDHYTLRGDDNGNDTGEPGSETWEPAFTFHGFRYVEVSGWPGELTPHALTAIVCHSDMQRTGWFECSDPLVNRLHENVVWSMRGNFFDLPTDCPQRDERLGWTGDIQVFAPTACFLYDAAGLLESWLGDLAAEQAETNGIVPYFVPNVMDPPVSPAAAWGDAAVIVPWVIYQRTGDAGILATQYASMCAWVDAIDAVAGPSRLWEQGIQFGDWVDPKAPADKPGDARTAPFIVATAYFAWSADLVAQAAAVLGRQADAARYAALAADVRRAFAAAYVTPAGRMVSDATTAYALAIEFALLPSAEQRRQAGQRLAALVRGAGYRISTGFVGTPLVCDALCAVGETAAAYRLLTQRLCPSWLYPITMGATTIWERWDSMLPDGSINPGEMTSFNHYALGAVADWLHRTVAGLAPAAPGYKALELRPVPGGGLTYARAEHTTPYGPAACGWRLADGAITVEVTVPANTTARVYLPGKTGAPLAVGAGSYRWSYAYSVPTPSRPALTLDSTLGDVVDNPRAYEGVMRAMQAHNFEFADRMDGQLTVTLRQATRLNPNSDRLLQRFQQALDEAQA